jgi:hypothetical protein
VDDALAAGYPESLLLIVEYCAEPLADGLFRKLAAYRVGPRVFQANSVHDRQWWVKHGATGIASDAHYEAERRLIDENPYADVLLRVFELAGIEYGRADFGIVDGQPVIWEINTNPQLGNPVAEHPSALRRASIARVWNDYLEALCAIQRPIGVVPAGADQPRAQR